MIDVLSLYTIPVYLCFIIIIQSQIIISIHYCEYSNYNIHKLSWQHVPIPSSRNHSAPEQFQRISCPSLPVLLLTVSIIHSTWACTLVTAVGIPLYHLVVYKILPCLKLILMFTRMWMGMFLSLLQVYHIGCQLWQHILATTPCTISHLNHLSTQLHIIILTL